MSSEKGDIFFSQITRDQQATFDTAKNSFILDFVGLLYLVLALFLKYDPLERGSLRMQLLLLKWPLTCKFSILSLAGPLLSASFSGWVSGFPAWTCSS